MKRIRGRLHPLSFARYLKYALSLSLIPFLHLAADFSKHRLIIALLQEAVLLVSMALLCFFYYRAGEILLTPHRLSLKKGLLFRRNTQLLSDCITALTCRSTPFQRICGACEVQLFLTGAVPIRRVRLLLWRQNAQQLCQALMPETTSCETYSPRGKDRLAIILLSVDLLTTGFFLVYTIRQLSRLFGQAVFDAALRQLSFLEAIVSVFVPAGLSLISALFLLVSLYSLLQALGKTYHLQVKRCGNLLLTYGGLFTITESRIRLACISSIDLQLTPTALLLHRYPLYLQAGGFTSADLPFLLYQPGQEEEIQKILPCFHPCSPSTPSAHRPLLPFIWRSGLTVFSLVILLLMSVTVSPSVTPLLGFGLFFSLGWLCMSFYSYRKEGFLQRSKQSICFYTGRRLTFHQIICPGQDWTLDILQTSITSATGWCHLRLRLPSRQKFLVRSLRYKKTESIRFIL